MRPAARIKPDGVVRASPEGALRRRTVGTTRPTGRWQTITVEIPS
jgi:hypothetical protein